MKLKNEYVYLPDIIGKGYKEFWNFKGRYRVVKEVVEARNQKQQHYG